MNCFSCVILGTQTFTLFFALKSISFLIYINFCVTFASQTQTFFKELKLHIRQTTETFKKSLDVSQGFFCDVSVTFLAFAEKKGLFFLFFFEIHYFCKLYGGKADKKSFSQHLTNYYNKAKKQ